MPESFNNCGGPCGGLGESLCNLKRSTSLNATNKNAKQTILLFPPNMPIVISSHETETSIFLFTITKTVISLFPILERNLFYPHSPFWNTKPFISRIAFWNASYFTYFPFWNIKLFISRIAYSILERHLFYDGFRNCIIL